MPKQHIYFEEPLRCKYCEEPMENNGVFCGVEHWRLWLKEQIPDSWRALHTWMKSYQSASGKQPSMDEIVIGTSFSRRSSVIHALQGLQKKNFVQTTLPANHKRRYRAIGVLPRRRET